MNQHASLIMNAALRDASPEAAVRAALSSLRIQPGGKVILIAVGKAAWRMARAALETLGGAIGKGCVITKYQHSQGTLPPLEIFEAGHPVPDENGCRATERALEMTAGLSPSDTVLFLLSGGGSALFEKPLIPLDELMSVTGQLLACGAGIVEINTLRKRLSAVKGGKFALHCLPARVLSIVLSDIIGDPMDMIASGPACPDSSTGAQALAIAEKYGLQLSEKARALLGRETPKALSNVTACVTGSVRQLCKSAANEARALGYQPLILTSSLSCEAREAGAFLAAIARDHQETPQSLCFLCGGETVVRLTGNGKGGRNQEIALAAAEGIAGCRDTCVFSFGSDGTDGPTDAAGGYADENTLAALNSRGIDVHQTLKNNDAYPALKAVDGLIMTGPTGTNVNDLSVVLIRR